MRKALSFVTRITDSLTATSSSSSRFHSPLRLAVCALLSLAIPAAAQRPPIRHVFTIVLENKGYAESFGPNSLAPYLSQQLTAQGELLTNYYGIGHNSLPNYIALVSGQAPNVITQSDCQIYQDFIPSSIVQVDANRKRRSTSRSGASSQNATSPIGSRPCCGAWRGSTRTMRNLRTLI
jgi:hypothetical protein